MYQLISDTQQNALILSLRYKDCTFLGALNMSVLRQVEVYFGSNVPDQLNPFLILNNTFQDSKPWEIAVKASAATLGSVFLYRMFKKAAGLNEKLKTVLILIYKSTILQQ